METAAGQAPNGGFGTCEGGVADQSSYWMPAVFDEADQVTLPEHIRVEYKAYGDPDFDRTTVQPIPAGLALQAGPEVQRFNTLYGTVSGSDSRLLLSLIFPSCVAVDSGGQPVLGSADGRHLSYPVAGTSTNCPGSHPYRIPTAIFVVDYGVSSESDWYLAGGSSTDRRLTAGLVSAWEPETMDAATNCVQAARSCGFAGGRSQLPDRFVAPDGAVLYTDTVTLTTGADRTPFDASVPPVLP